MATVMWRTVLISASPSSTSKSEDLPAPEGPRTAQSEPVRMDADTPCSTFTSPIRLRTWYDTLCTPRSNHDRLWVREVATSACTSGDRCEVAWVRTRASDRATVLKSTGRRGVRWLLAGTRSEPFCTYREGEGVLGSFPRLVGGPHSGAAWRLRLLMGVGILSIILRIHLRSLNVGQVAEAQSAAELATGPPARSFREQLQSSHNQTPAGGLAKPTACVPCADYAVVVTNATRVGHPPGR